MEELGKLLGEQVVCGGAVGILTLDATRERNDGAEAPRAECAHWGAALVRRSYR